MTSRPYVYLKYAMSLDGKMATSSGNSKWITGPEARMEAHRLRNQVDGLIIGRGTIDADNPSLTTRLEGETCRHPTRIILSASGRMNENARVWDTEMPGQSLFVTTDRCPSLHRKQLEKRDVETLTLPSDSRGTGIDLAALLQALGQKGMSRIMVEGGPKVLTSFMQQDLFDEIWAFVAPKIIGGSSAPTPFDGKGFSLVANSPAMEHMETITLGRDTLIKVRRQARSDSILD